MKKQNSQTPAAAKGVNALNDPEERKKFKTALSTATHYFQEIDDLKESLKENVADLSSQYGLDKKTIRKLAVIMYKRNYGSLQEENRHFEILYETVIEGKLRSDFEPLNESNSNSDEE